MKFSASHFLFLYTRKKLYQIINLNLPPVILNTYGYESDGDNDIIRNTVKVQQKHMYDSIKSIYHEIMIPQVVLCETTKMPKTVCGK